MNNNLPAQESPVFAHWICITGSLWFASEKEDWWSCPKSINNSEKIRGAHTTYIFTLGDSMYSFTLRAKMRLWAMSTSGNRNISLHLVIYLILMIFRLGCIRDFMRRRCSPAVVLHCQRKTRSLPPQVIFMQKQIYRYIFV